MVQQMNSHLENVYSKYISAYRNNYGCHSVLTHTTEIWKSALDNKKYVGVIMSDLSKAFDCLPHDLLIEKLRLYKFGDSSRMLLESYLKHRFQRVKLENVVSSWGPLKKGVRQRPSGKCGRTTMFQCIY